MNFDKYRNQMEYPVKPKHPGRTADDATLTAGVVVRDEWLCERGEYRNEDARLTNLFKKDAFEELGIADNPKREKLYEIAWELGHADGLSEVWWHMVDLAQLIKED